MRTEEAFTDVNWDLKLSPYSNRTEPRTDTYRSLYRRRDDPMSTRPIGNGKFVYPTAYFTEVQEPKHGMSKSSRYGTRYNEPPNPASVNHPNVSLISTANVVNAAVVDAGRGNASYGETAAELGQTAQMFKSGVFRSVAAVNQLRRKQFAQAFNTLGIPGVAKKAKSLSKDRSLQKAAGETAKDAANRHLLIQFGIMPIVDDIHTAIELFEGKLNKAPDRGDVIFGFATNEYDVPQQDSEYYHPHGGRYSMSVDTKVKQRCKIRYVCENKSLLYAANQLGLANPTKLAYDMLALSFVFDWFFPIGNYLETMSSTFGLRVTDGYVTTVVETKARIGARINTGYGGGVLIEDPKLDVWSFQRYKTDGSMQVPEPQMPEIGIGKAMTALSLLAQRLG